MALLDHFHPPLHGPRRWEGFHHAWATFIAQQLNQGILPADYFAESEISIGPEFEIDVATFEEQPARGQTKVATKPLWTPTKPRITTKLDFGNLDVCEIRVYQDLGGAELRAAIELVSPANKDREGSRQTFAAKCAGYLKHGIGLVIIDIVTSRSANLHATLFEMLEIKNPRGHWHSPSGLYAVAYRPMPVHKRPRLEAWPESLALGKVLPTLPLWLRLDVVVPVRLEDSYQATCDSLRISA
jgi:hypothetical protein